MASIPAECIRRLFVAERPHASGNESRTADQKTHIVVYIESRSAGSDFVPLNGDRTPSGLLMLFLMTFAINTLAEVVRHRLRKKYAEL